MKYMEPSDSGDVTTFGSSKITTANEIRSQLYSPSPTGFIKSSTDFDDSSLVKFSTSRWLKLKGNGGLELGYSIQRKSTFIDPLGSFYRNSSIVCQYVKNDVVNPEYLSKVATIDCDDLQKLDCDFYSHYKSASNSGFDLRRSLNIISPSCDIRGSFEKKCSRK